MTYSKPRLFIRSILRLAVPALLAMAIASPHAVAASKYPEGLNPCLPHNQQRMACVGFLKNAGESIRQFGANLARWLTFRPSEVRCIEKAFETNPALWENLQATRGRMHPSEENQLMIYNTDDGMTPVCKKSYGFCWGHASMKFYMTRLPFYDPKGAFESIPSDAPGSKKWVEFYLAKMRLIMEGKPQVIPGFANLHDFSAHPALNDWFKRLAADAWQIRMAHLKNLGMFMSHKNMTTAEGLQFVEDVRARLAQGYAPKIIFDENANKAVKGEEKSLHVVLAIDVHPMKNDKTAIVIWDDKKPHPHSLEVLVINHHGGKNHHESQAFFAPWRWVDPDAPIGERQGYDLGLGRVEQFRIAPENDVEARAMTLNLAKFCEERPEVCEKLGDDRVLPSVKPKLPIPGKPWNDFEYLN